MNSSLQPFKNRQGFTLIEIVIAVAIMAILAAIAQPQWMNYVRRSRVNEAHITLATMHKAMLAYKDVHGHVIPDLSKITTLKLESAPKFVYGIAPDARHTYLATNCAGGIAACTTTYPNNSQENLDGATPDNFDYRIMALLNEFNRPTFQIDGPRRGWSDPLTAASFSNGLPVEYMLAAVGNIDSDPNLQTVVISTNGVIVNFCDDSLNGHSLQYQGYSIGGASVCEL